MRSAHTSSARPWTPTVGVDDVGAGAGVLHVVGALHGAAVLGSDGLAGLHELGVGMFSFGPQATKFMPSLEHTTISERATLLAASPMNTRVLPLMS